MREIKKLTVITLVLICMLCMTMPTYAATKKVTKKYTVTFKDSITGKTIKKVKVNAGADVKPPAVPKHKGWKFEKWNKSLKNIKKNKVIKTVYYKNVLQRCISDEQKTLERKYQSITLNRQLESDKMSTMAKKS